MHEEKLFSPGGDPLRFLDARFEPLDPIFDAEDPAFPRFRRRRPRSAAAAAVAAAATLACGGAGRPAEVVSDAILVQLERDASPPPRTALTAEGPPIVALAAVSSGSEEDGPLLRLPVEGGANPAAAAAEAAASPGVAYAEPIYVYRSTRVPDDPRYKDLWGMAKIGAPAAWARSTGDKAVVVAVVDDGVALDHPDLKPNLWGNDAKVGTADAQDDDLDDESTGRSGWDFVDDDPDPSPAASGEERWHGTHVAGTIGAAGDNHTGVTGVDWKVSLMALRAIGPRGGRSDQLAKAIDFATEHGARVINASWGGGGNSQVIANAVARANRKGVLFVAAAGNDAAPSPSFPANLRLDNVVSVGASTPGDLLADFSDRGAMVAAPGVGILSTTAPGKYERYDGTSMAAPHVSGLAALLWSVHPKATLAQVRKAIVASAIPIRGVQSGRIDASRALALLDEQTGTGPAVLKLSREALRFTVRPGRAPAAQTVSVSANGSAQVVAIAADASFIGVSRAEAETPARIGIKVDAKGLKAGTHQGHVTFTAESGPAAVLTVTAQVGDAPPIAVQGDGCALVEGKLHAREGAGCALLAADGNAAAQWTLPGGAQVSGARLYGQFVRRGDFQVLVGSRGGAAEAIPVVIE
ncbi:MAG TPA: S8 family peptidase [Myxococcales bacterium]|nr:S8 family peptidase [Myxococcales bacterium]